MSTESVMPSNHLILCHPLLPLLSIFPSIRVLSSESAICIRWPKYWSPSKRVFKVASQKLGIKPQHFAPWLKATPCPGLCPLILPFSPLTKVLLPPGPNWPSSFSDFSIVLVLWLQDHTRIWEEYRIQDNQLWPYPRKRWIVLMLNLCVTEKLLRRKLATSFGREGRGRGEHTVEFHL